MNMRARTVNEMELGEPSILERSLTKLVYPYAVIKFLKEKVTPKSVFFCHQQ